MGFSIPLFFLFNREVEFVLVGQFVDDKKVNNSNFRSKRPAAGTREVFPLMLFTKRFFIAHCCAGDELLS